jgi:hypothetical protein
VLAVLGPSAAAIRVFNPYVRCSAYLWQCPSPLASLRIRCASRIFLSGDPEMQSSLSRRAVDSALDKVYGQRNGITNERYKSVNAMRFCRIIVGLVMTPALVSGGDFELWHVGLGPIQLHTSLTFVGNTARVTATATNSMSEAIENVRICLSTSVSPCLLSIWNTTTWLPGTTLQWDFSLTVPAPNFSYEARIDSIELVGDRNDSALRKLKSKKGPMWDIGRVIDTDRAIYLAGVWQSTVSSGTATTTTNGSIRASTLTLGGFSTTSGSIQAQSETSVRYSTAISAGPIYREVASFAVETDRYLYFARESETGRYGLAHLVVSSSVLLNVEGRKLIFLDSDQKLHEAAILKQILKPDPKSPTPTAARSVPMTNADVLALKAAGFRDELVVMKVRASAVRFQLDTSDLIELKRAGLSEVIVEAMVQASKGTL